MKIRNIMDSLVQDLSPGEKRKLSLALTLIGNTKLVILDEPTSNLDFKSRDIIWNLINDIANKGRSVFLSTH